jgi:hypothetical protein
VFGAGLAATLSTWVSCAILLVSMFQRGVVSSADLATLPRKHEVVPYLKKGAVLAFRMVVTFGACVCLCCLVRAQRRVARAVHSPCMTVTHTPRCLLHPALHDLRRHGHVCVSHLRACWGCVAGGI